MIPSEFNAYIIAAPEHPRRIFGGVDKSQIIYLRFADQAEQESVFAAAGIVPREGEMLPADFHWPGIGDISIVGVIYNDDAVIGGDGEIVTPATPKPGWHVNILPAAS